MAAVCNCVTPRPNCSACHNYMESGWTMQPDTGWIVKPTQTWPTTSYTPLSSCSIHCFCEPAWKDRHKACCKCGTMLATKFVRFYLKNQETL